jgi:hypothetical protein
LKRNPIALKGLPVAVVGETVDEDRQSPLRISEVASTDEPTLVGSDLKLLDGFGKPGPPGDLQIDILGPALGLIWMKPQASEKRLGRAHSTPTPLRHSPDKSLEIVLVEQTHSVAAVVNLGHGRPKGCTHVSHGPCRHSDGNSTMNRNVGVE